MGYGQDKRYLNRRAVSSPDYIPIGLAVSFACPIFPFNLVDNSIPFFCLTINPYDCLAEVHYPLFNNLSPLEDGELRNRLLNLADRSGFKAQSIEVIDGSKIQSL